MRAHYKIFTLAVLFTLAVSLLYNLNVMWGYCWFDPGISDKLFGLSYTVPMVVCGYVICKQAKFLLEKLICRFFLCIAFSALLDEIIFDPYTPSYKEHLTAIILVIILFYYERIFNRIKETRD